jgi:hypothetical protein
MEWVVVVFYLLVPIAIVGFLLYAVYRVTMDVSAIRGLLEAAHARDPARLS